MKNFDKAKSKIADVGKTVSENIVKTGKQIKESEAAEKITKEAKQNAEKVKQAVSGGTKIGAEKVKSSVTEGATVGANAIKNAVDELSSQPYLVDGHTVVRFSGLKTQLLIPDEYEVITDKELKKAICEMFGIKKFETSYIGQTANSLNVVTFFKQDKNQAMDFDDLDGLVAGIHESLAENQGLVEAKNGKTKRGYDYIYSIVKSVGSGEEMPFGVRYFIRLDIRLNGKIIEIYGNFEEQGTTGIRESMAACMASNAGICEMGSDKWNEDPFDPEYKKGNRKNLAEKEGLDGLFPENPLTQAHAFLLAVLNDELVIVKKESEDETPSDTEEDDSLSEEEKKAKSNELIAGLFVDECRRHRYTVEIEPERSSEGDKSETSDEDKKEKKSDREKLDDTLRRVVDEYNAAYTLMNDKGTTLYIQRERSLDLIKNVENLINSIANHPKEFDTTISEIVMMREEFTSTCEYAKQELEAAQKSAMSAGVGIAGGAAVAALAPSAAMWVATTFGTASTGTAISALSGAAAQSAALAWLGGGALTAGGGGMAAGNALLVLAGPVGWGIAGATLLSSVVLFANKKLKLDKQKKEEIEAVLKNIESIKEVDGKIKAILDKTTALRDAVNEQYGKCLNTFGKDFKSLQEEYQVQLGTLVNETKSLAALLSEGVQ